jgi:cytochrome c oxidase subunit 2
VRRGHVVLIAVSAALLSCGGPQQSVVDPASVQSSKIAFLWGFLLVLLGIIFVVVVGLMLGALLRRPRGIEQEPLERIHAPSHDTERALTTRVTWASVATTVILLILIVISVSTGRAVSRLGQPKAALTIAVTGNQWWWHIRYLNDEASRIIVTANEIHIPVGVPVEIRGSSLDVIHSFWVPNLHGKVDLIPSRTTTETFQADRPGRFRGQCAEFCGLQHAHMALWVIAEPEDQFRAWERQQLQPANAPDNPDTTRGQEVFLKHACILCHSIQGTPAAGQNGPDLTHFGGRISLAAGTLPNTKGNLAGWISDPQQIKPGNHMATIPLAPDELQSVIDYLESLK